MSLYCRLLKDTCVPRLCELSREGTACRHLLHLASAGGLRLVGQAGWPCEAGVAACDAEQSMEIRLLAVDTRITRRPMKLVWSAESTDEAVLVEGRSEWLSTEIPFFGGSPGAASVERARVTTRPGATKHPVLKLGVTKQYESGRAVAVQGRLHLTWRPKVSGLTEMRNKEAVRNLLQAERIALAKYTEFRKKLTYAEGQNQSFALEQQIKEEILPQLAQINKDLAAVLAAEDIPTEQQAYFIRDLAAALAEPSLPSLHEIEQVRRAANESAKLESRFTATLPLVPGLLSWELSISSGGAIQRAWGRLIAWTRSMVGL
jgi:hypothetical protein